MESLCSWLLSSFSSLAFSASVSRFLASISPNFLWSSWNSNKVPVLLVSSNCLPFVTTSEISISLSRLLSSKCWYLLSNFSLSSTKSATLSERKSLPLKSIIKYLLRSIRTPPVRCWKIDRSQKKLHQPYRCWIYSETGPKKKVIAFSSSAISSLLVLRAPHFIAIFAIIHFSHSFTIAEAKPWSPWFLPLQIKKKKKDCW